MQIKKRPLFVLLVLSSMLSSGWHGNLLYSQPLQSVLPEEPPSSLFASKLGDDDVEILVQGFWEASVLSSGTVSSNGSGPSFAFVPFLFKQIPDLYAFLRFREKWFFEGYIANEASSNRFVLSFEGDELDSIKLAKLGNAGIVMPEYPFLSFGSPKSSFGFAMNAFFEEPKLSLDLLLRWDKLAWKTRRFSGSVEASETVISPKDMIRGRRFILPDAPISSLELKESGPNGSRVLALDEYSVSFGSGLLMLETPGKGKLTASYQGQSGAVEDLVLYEYKVNAQNKIELVSSDYEVRNSYALPDSADFRRLFVRNMATGQADTNYEVHSFAPAMVQVVKAGFDSPSGYEAYRKPFYDTAPWYYNDEAMPANTGEAFQIIALSISAAEGPILLEPATVAGSISVYRDGIPSNSFVYDSASGSLALIPEASSGEYIEVRYATESPDASNGTLVYGLGTRFPGLGLDWSIALGGRQPLFGQGYDEAALERPSWLALSLGTEFKSDKAQANAALSLRYNRAGSGNYYRVLGMEETDSGKHIASFGQASPNDNLILEALPDDSLSTEPAFKEMMQTLHENAASNRVLKIRAKAEIDVNEEIRLLRYLDALPMDSYKKLSFFIRADKLKSGSTITIKLGDGSSSGAVINLAASELEYKWKRIELDLDPIASVRVYDGSGAMELAANISASYSFLAYAGLAEIIISGMEADSVIEIDEICLLEPLDGMDLRGEAGFLLDWRNGKKGPFLKGNASALYQDAFSGNARIEAGWAEDFFDFTASINPSYGAAMDSLSVGMGYSAAFPSKKAPKRVVDEFYWKSLDGRKKKAVEAALAFGPYSALAKAGFEENAFYLHQNWSAAINLSSFALISANASLDARGHASDVGPLEQQFDFGQAWMEAWPSLLPKNEEDADSRKMEAKFNFGRSLLEGGIVHAYSPDHVGNTVFSAKLEWPFKIAGWTLMPYYKRLSSLDEAAVSLSFLDDMADIGKNLSSSGALWARIPYAEIFVPDEAFKHFAASATNAEHRADTGFSLKRPIGNGLADLFIPASIEAGFGRQESKNADVFSVSHNIDLKLGGGAANLFGSSGSNPLLNWLYFDEYSYKNNLLLKVYALDRVVLPKFYSNIAVSLEAQKAWSALFVNEFSIEKTRADGFWQESVQLVLSVKPEKGWLGRLSDFAKAVFQGQKNETSREEQEGKNASWISEWLEDTISAKPVFTDSFDLKTGLGQKSMESGNTAISLSFDYSSRIRLADSMYFGIGAGIWQSMTIQKLNKPWSFGYSFSIDGKLVF